MRATTLAGLVALGGLLAAGASPAQAQGFGGYGGPYGGPGFSYSYSYSNYGGGGGYPVYLPPVGYNRTPVFLPPLIPPVAAGGYCGRPGGGYGGYPGPFGYPGGYGGYPGGGYGGYPGGYFDDDDD